MQTKIYNIYVLLLSMYVLGISVADFINFFLWIGGTQSMC